MEHNEQSLMQRIRNGKAEDYGRLVVSYGPALMMFVGRIVAQQEDAEDVVQNTFVAAYERRGDYDPKRASLRTWLQRIAYHEALNLLRHRKQQVPLPLETGDDIPDELPAETTAEQLDKAIGQLTPEDQMLLQLYYYDQRPLKEIAYITAKAGVPLNREASRLSSQLHRIRQRLRIILTRMNDE